MVEVSIYTFALIGAFMVGVTLGAMSMAVLAMSSRDD
jgi:hypothetical protein